MTMRRDDPWWVVLMIVYQGNYDAPWCQIVGGNLTNEQAQNYVHNMEQITAAERRAPVHLRHGGQTDRFIIMVPSRSGLTAIQRAILVLNEARLRQMHDVLRVEALSAPNPLEDDDG